MIDDIIKNQQRVIEMLENRLSRSESKPDFIDMEFDTRILGDFWVDIEENLMRKINKSYGLNRLIKKLQISDDFIAKYQIFDDGLSGFYASSEDGVSGIMPSTVNESVINRTKMFASLMYSGTFMRNPPPYVTTIEYTVGDKKIPAMIGISVSMQKDEIAKYDLKIKFLDKELN